MQSALTVPPVSGFRSGKFIIGNRQKYRESISAYVKLKSAELLARHESHAILCLEMILFPIIL